MRVPKSLVFACLIVPLSSCKPPDGTEGDTESAATITITKFKAGEKATLYFADAVKGDPAEVIPKITDKSDMCTLAEGQVIQGKLDGVTSVGDAMAKKLPYVKIAVSSWGGVKCQQATGYFATTTLTDVPPSSQELDSFYALKKCQNDAEVCGNFSPLLRQACRDLKLGNEKTCGQNAKWSVQAYTKIQDACEKKHVGELNTSAVFHYQYCGPELQYMGAVPPTASPSPAPAVDPETAHHLQACAVGSDGRVCGDFSDYLRKACVDLKLGNDDTCNKKNEWTDDAYIKIRAECLKQQSASMGTGTIYLHQNCAPDYQYLPKKAGNSEKNCIDSDCRVWVCDGNGSADSACGKFTKEEIDLCNKWGGGAATCGSAADALVKELRWSKDFYYKISEQLKK